MKYLKFILAFSLCFISINAEENNKKTSALYLIGSDGSYVASGRSLVFREDDGCTVSTYSYSNIDGISLNFCKGTSTYYHITFYPPPGMKFTPGIYRKAQRFPFNDKIPGLDIGGDGCGCNRVAGEFEVLEVVYDSNGKITSFAANFTERCEEIKPPIYGSVRYNSNIPLSTRFTEIFANGKSNILFLKKRKNEVDESNSETFYFNDENIQMLPLPYGGDGVSININTNNGNWIFNFSAPIDDKLMKGFYEYGERYPYNGFLNPGIEVILPEGEFINPRGSFKVLKCKRNKKDTIQEIALTFEIKNDQNEILEGGFLYKKEDIESKQNYFNLPDEDSIFDDLDIF